MTYKDSFPDFDYELPIIDGFRDASWHNDACPSLIKDLGNDYHIQIFCNYKDKSKSEFWDTPDADYKLFSVCMITPEDLNSAFLIESNDIEEIKRFIASLN